MKKVRRSIFLAAAITAAVFLFPGCSGGDSGGGDPSLAESIEKGKEALKEKDVDAAIGAFEAAYRADKNDSTAIVYSSLGKLASIAKDGNVRNLMKDRLGLTDYPGTIDNLFTTEWMKTYGDEKYPGLSEPSWIKGTDVYKNSLTNNQLSASTWPILMFANLIDKNPNGLNNLLDSLLSSVFGASFEAAAARSASLDYDTSVEVDEDTLKAFGLSDIFEGDKIDIGRAELDILFSAVRIFKASLEWVAAYNWDTDLTFMRFDWEKIETDLKNHQPTSLPFRNNFLKDRDNGMMAKSKADFIKAIGVSATAYDNILKSDYFPQGARETLAEYKWVSDGLTKLKEAINSGNTFYVKESSGGDSYTNDDSGKVLVGINMGKLFTPGQLAIDKLITTTGSGNTIAPKFFGSKDGSDVIEEITSDKAASITSYESIGFELKLESLKEIIKDDSFPDTLKLPLFPADIGETIYGFYHP
jgi:hypothetical protein